MNSRTMADQNYLAGVIEAFRLAHYARQPHKLLLNEQRKELRMNSMTFKTIQTFLDMDDSISMEHKIRILRVCKNPEPKQESPSTEDRIVRRKEVSESGTQR